MEGSALPNRKFVSFMFLIGTAVFVMYTQKVYSSYPNSIQSSGKSPEIKVLLGKKIPEMVISGNDIGRQLFKKDNTSYKSYSGKKSIKFSCNQLGKSKVMKNPKLLASLRSATGLLSVNDQKFWGDLHIYSDENASGCQLVNEVPLEVYISSLLASEMNSAWHIEALKAQAVAARSYAINKLRNSKKEIESEQEVFHIENSEKDQVMGDFINANSRTFLAAKETEGEILVLENGKITPIFYYAECGGPTLYPEDVWNNYVEGYSNRIPCPTGEENSRHKWELNLPLKKFIKFVQWLHERKLQKINNIETIGSGRFLSGEIIVVPDKVDQTELKIYFGDQLNFIKKPLLRRFFGVELIPSNHYIVEYKNHMLKFSGFGRGHGVGMSQLGALQMAQAGKNYREILQYFFPEHVITKRY